MVAHALAFLGVSALVIVTPGQDTALTIRNTLLGGRRSGVLTAAGVASGQAFWTLAASLGLAALLSASEPAFLAVRLAGAAYLVFLGIQTLLGASRHGDDRPRRAGSSFRQGLLSNLGNPKMAVFFTSLLPQFGGDVLPGAPRAGSRLLLDDVRVAHRVRVRGRARAVTSCAARACVPGSTALPARS